MLTLLKIYEWNVIIIFLVNISSFTNGGAGSTNWLWVFFFGLVSYKMRGAEGGGEGSVTKTRTHTICVWPVIQADVLI